MRSRLLREYREVEETAPPPQGMGASGSWDGGGRTPVVLPLFFFREPGLPVAAKPRRQRLLPFPGSFSISPSNEYSGLISFRIDWFDLLSVQGTLKSLLHNQSSKASILQCSAFFIDQLLQLYMTTGKTIALTIQTFVGKVMSLLFNMLSRLVITSNE